MSAGDVDIQSVKLCGLNCTWLTLRLLGKDDVSYSALMATFPSVKREGMSLNQIQLFLKKQGLYTSKSDCSDRDLVLMPVGTVALTLVDGKSPHIYLRKTMGDGELMVLNPPYRPCPVSR